MSYLIILFTGINKLDLKNKKIQVSASFYPLYFFSSQIGGDKAEVKNITPPGVEPHDYDPSLQDIVRIESSNILILNGGFEKWGNKIKNNLKSTNVRVIITGEGLFAKNDPHFWLNPRLAKKEVEKITQGFIAIDPANGSYYKNNKKQLDYKLDQLDAKYKKGLANCMSRDMITSHAAFTYLADAYGLNQLPISGLSPDEEPSAMWLARVVDFAKKNKVKYIFFEKLVSPKISQTIAQEVGAKTLALDPIEGLLDDDIKQGKNYFTIMETNLHALRTALQCSN